MFDFNNNILTLLGLAFLISIASIFFKLPELAYNAFLVWLQSYDIDSDFKLVAHLVKNYDKKLILIHGSSIPNLTVKFKNGSFQSRYLSYILPHKSVLLSLNQTEFLVSKSYNRLISLICYKRNLKPLNGVVASMSIDTLDDTNRDILIEKMFKVTLGINFYLLISGIEKIDGMPMLMSLMSEAEKNMIFGYEEIDFKSVNYDLKSIVSKVDSILLEIEQKLDRLIMCKEGLDSHLITLPYRFSDALRQKLCNFLPPLFSAGMGVNLKGIFFTAEHNGRDLFVQDLVLKKIALEDSPSMTLYRKGYVILTFIATFCILFFAITGFRYYTHQTVRDMLNYFANIDTCIRNYQESIDTKNIDNISKEIMTIHNNLEKINNYYIFGLITNKHKNAVSLKILKLLDSIKFQINEMYKNIFICTVPQNNLSYLPNNREFASFYHCICSIDKLSNIEKLYNKFISFGQMKDLYAIVGILHNEKKKETLSQQIRVESEPLSVFSNPDQVIMLCKQRLDSFISSLNNIDHIRSHIERLNTVTSSIRQGAFEDSVFEELLQCLEAIYKNKDILNILISEQKEIVNMPEIQDLLGRISSLELLKSHIDVDEVRNGIIAKERDSHEILKSFNIENISIALKEMRDLHNAEHSLTATLDLYLLENFKEWPENIVPKAIFDNAIRSVLRKRIGGLILSSDDLLGITKWLETHKKLIPEFEDMIIKFILKLHRDMYSTIVEKHLIDGAKINIGSEKDTQFRSLLKTISPLFGLEVDVESVIDNIGFGKIQNRLYNEIQLQIYLIIMQKIKEHIENAPCKKCVLFVSKNKDIFDKLIEFIKQSPKTDYLMTNIPYDVCKLILDAYHLYTYYEYGHFKILISVNHLKHSVERIVGNIETDDGFCPIISNETCKSPPIKNIKKINIFIKEVTARGKIVTHNLKTLSDNEMRELIMDTSKHNIANEKLDVKILIEPSL